MLDDLGPDIYDAVDFDFLVSKVTDLASEALSGEVELIEKTVKVQIPKQIVEIVETIASKTEYTEQDILNKLCSNNLKEEINKITKMKTTQDGNPFDALKENPQLASLAEKFFDVEGKFAEMTNMIGSLTNIAEVLEKTNEEK